MRTKQFKPEEVNVSEEWQDAFTEELQQVTNNVCQTLSKY